jgi:hypothetical protein
VHTLFFGSPQSDGNSQPGCSICCSRGSCRFGMLLPSCEAAGGAPRSALKVPSCLTAVVVHCKPKGSLLIRSIMQCCVLPALMGPQRLDLCIKVVANSFGVSIVSTAAAKTVTVVVDLTRDKCTWRNHVSTCHTSPIARFGTITAISASRRPIFRVSPTLRQIPGCNPDMAQQMSLKGRAFTAGAAAPRVSTRSVAVRAANREQQVCGVLSVLGQG